MKKLSGMQLSKFKWCIVSVLLFCLVPDYAKGQSAQIKGEQLQMRLIKDSLGVVNSLNKIGMLYYVENPDSSFYYGLKAKAMATRLNYPKGQADADNVIATLFSLKGLHRESLFLYGKTLIAYQKQLDTANVVQVMMNTALVYANLIDTAKAIGLLQRAIQTGKELQRDSIMSLVYANYVSTNFKLPDDSVRYYIKRSKEIAGRHKDRRMLIGIKQLEAFYLLNQGRRDEALTLIQEALAEARKYDLAYFEINSLDIYAAYYINQPDSALNYLNREYKIAIDRGFIFLKVPILKSILYYTELSGDKAKIIDVHRLLEAAISDENENLKKFTGDYVKYNSIENDNALLGTTNRNNKIRIWMLASICIVSILMLIFIYRLYKTSRRHARKQAELNRQILEQNRALQEADEFKNKLVGILAHDFRTPLISTISIAGIMRDNPGFTEAEMELFYGNIEKDARNMLESFDTILQWIKQQLSGYQLKVEEQVLRDLFHETSELFSQQAEVKRLKFINQIPIEIMVVSDKEMLQFINRNILSNAIKFSPEDGKITISCTRNETGFTVMVADDGPGLDTGTLSKLFTASNNFGLSTQHGAGIALSMCRDFIQKLGGSIWAENKEPNGAIFYYTIPFAGREG